MGYETKLIIGRLTDMKGMKLKDADYVIPIAQIDLCNSCFEDTFLNKETDTHKVYFYPDGDTETGTDCYGSTLFAIDPKRVLNKMVKANKVEKYRRYNAAIPLLRNLIKDFKGENLTCILFGH